MRRRPAAWIFLWLLLGVQCRGLPEGVAAPPDAAWRRAMAAGEDAEAHGRWRDAESQYRLALQEARALGSEDPRVADSLLALADNLAGRDARDVRDLVPLYERALAIRRKAFGSRDASVAEALEALVGARDAVGKGDEAVSLLKEAVAIRERTQGAGHADLVLPLQTLALLAERQGRDGDAEPLRKRVLSILRRYPERKDLNPFSDLRALGDLYRRHHRYAEAAAVYEESARALEDVRWAKDPALVGVLTTLGSTYALDRRPAQAAEAYARALKLQERASGPHDMQTIDAALRLAGACDQAGEWAKAERLIGDVVARLRSSPESWRGYLLKGYQRLGEMRFRRGDYAAAAEWLSKALPLARRTGARSEADALVALGRCQRRSGSSARAEATFRRALAALASDKAREQREAVPALLGLAELRAFCGDSDGAWRFLREAISIRTHGRTTVPPRVTAHAKECRERDAPGIRGVAEMLDAFLACEGYLEAETLARKLVSLREAALGPNHACVADALAALALAEAGVGKTNEAIALWQRVLAIHERARPADALLLASVHARLGALLDRERRRQDAAPHLRRALDLREAHLPHDHALVAASAEALAQHYETEGKPAEADRIRARVAPPSALGTGRGPAAVLPSQ